MEKIEHFLNNNKIEFKAVKYPEKVKNADEALIHIGLPIRQIAKSLIIKTKDTFILFLLPSNKKLNTNSISKKLKTDLKLATTDEVFEISGYKVGAVSPLLMKNSIPIYMDESLIKFQEVGIGSGSKGIEIILNPNDLTRLLDITVMDLTQ